MEDGHPPLRAHITPAAATRLRRAYEIYATYYDIHYPNEERHAGRPLQDGADVRAPCRPRRRVRREVRMGASELVRLERGRTLRGPPAQRLGRRALVDRDRGRAPRHSRARGPVRRVELREDRGRGDRRVRVPAAPLRERRRPSGRERGLHADAEPPGRHRVRRDGDAARSSGTGSSPARRSGTTTSRGSASTSTRMEAFGCAT